MLGLRPMELLMILAVLLLLFGATRLPALGSSLGSAIRNFRRGFSGEGEPTPEEKKGQPGALASSTTVDQNASAKAPSHQG